MALSGAVRQDDCSMAQQVAVSPQPSEFEPTGLVLNVREDPQAILGGVAVEVKHLMVRCL